jgi:hypothetical protein
MRKVLFILFLIIILTAGNMACQMFAGTKEAFNAYKKEAKVLTRAEYESKRKALKFFLGPTSVPHIMQIDYKLESGEPAGKDQIKLEVLETIHLEHEDMDGKMRRKSKHYVLMQKTGNNRWQSVDVEVEDLD